MSESKKEPTFTVAYKKSLTGNFFIGIVPEVPGAASQGKTVPELVENLRKAVSAIFEANRLEALEKKKLFFDDETPCEESFSMIA